MPEEPRLPGALPFTLLVVVVSFVAATVLTWYSAAQIDEGAAGLASNMAPSIEHLAAVRGEVRQVQFLLHRALQEPQVGRAEVDASLERVNTDIRAYLALPTFPGENNYWGRLQRTSAALNQAIEQSLTQLALGARAEAETTARGAVADASQETIDAALAAIDFNARHGRVLAEKVAQTRRQSLRLGLGLDLLCAALAVVLARRQLARYGALLEAYTGALRERSGELEWFSSRVAHDLLTPNAAARMSLEMMQHAQLEAQRTMHLQRALRCLESSGELVAGLLEFARSGARSPGGSWCDAARVIEGVVFELQPLAEQAGVTLTVEGLEPALAACSTGVLESLVVNLARNAVKHMGASPVRQVRVRSQVQGRLLRVEVEDTGPGLAPELAGRVYQPYTRARGNQPGLGLGLASVKRLAEGHGGAVGYQSRPGQGSTFWFELPIAQAPRG